MTAQQCGRTSMNVAFKFAICATELYTKANHDDLTQPGGKHRGPTLPVTLYQLKGDK